ncbi:MAG: hypothetical protein R3E68_21170 [Burkholderiaceae bacterium]
MANGTGLLICAVLVVYSVRQLLRSYASGNQVYETFVYPEWYQYAVPPPVFLMLMVLFVRRLRGHDQRSHDAWAKDFSRPMAAPATLAPVR